MSYVDFKRVVIFLFVFFFLNSYYSVNPQHLSSVEDIDNFESYSWGIDLHEELLRALAGAYKGNLNAITESTAKDGGGVVLKIRLRI